MIKTRNKVNTNYIFKVKTDNAGSSNNDQFTLPLVSSGTYDFYIDWGDGVVDRITTYNQSEVTHTYSGGAGTYTPKIWGLLSGWAFNNSGDPQKLTGISQVGIFDHNNEDGAFYGCSNLTSIDATDSPLIKFGSTDIVGFFRNTGLTSVEWSNYNFSSVEDATNFLNGVTLNTSNYDSLLNLIDGQSVQNNVTFHAGNSEYTGFSSAGTAHTKLINQFSWTITDNGASIHANTIRWYDSYDETTITEASGEVSQWNDKSTAGANASQSSSEKPLTGTTTIDSKNTLLFDGAGDNLDFADIDFIDKTIFMVIKPNSSGVTRQLFASSLPINNKQIRIDDTNALSVASSKNNWLPGAGSGNVLSTFTIEEEPTVVGFTGGVKLGFIKNSSYETVGIDRVNTDPFPFNQVGTRMETTDPFGGEIAEIIILSSVASAGDITDITDYLIEKWGVV